MSYRFDVSYPKSALSKGLSLIQKQEEILQRFPQCHYQGDHNHPRTQITLQDYHSTIYVTDKPQEIARIASSLANADRRIFIASVHHNGQAIYYHPAEIDTLTPVELNHYIRTMEDMSQIDRTLHDYLVNLYHSVPTHKEFPLV